MTRRVWYVCENCGKKVSKKVDYKRFSMKRHHFCSRRCYYEYRIKHPEEYPKELYNRDSILNKVRPKRSVRVQ